MEREYERPRSRETPPRDEPSSSRGGRSFKHPRHLKGKEIGLFYANRHKESGRPKRDRKALKPIGTVLLSENKKQQISELIKTCSTSKDSSINTRQMFARDTSFKKQFLENISGNILDKLRELAPLENCTTLDERYYQQFLETQRDEKYIKMQRVRAKLPSYEMKDQIVKTIEENQVSVISGETGCGKTTQVAQFILDEYLLQKKGTVCKIFCTQPRRISAVSVAARVAEERAEVLGVTVGYQIRLEKTLPRDYASITFCTTGILLKRMEYDPGLSEISHLILDEIHERDIMSDFLISLIKKVIAKRPDLKLILMSATLDSEKFSKYYDNCPTLTIPGFTYHVEEYYLEDVIERTKFHFDQFLFPNSSLRFPMAREKKRKCREYAQFIEPHMRHLEAQKKYSRETLVQLRNPQTEELNLNLVLELLIDICKNEKEQGAILVFLTGYMEISNLHNKMQNGNKFPSDRYLIIPLHSQMPTVDQKQIFETPPPHIRKIILSTNIAETSITIDDVVFVIDCGRIKKTNFYLEKNIQTLLPEWVSLANANQRKGRAGRVKPGVCFHLFSRARAMVLEKHMKPEILRTRLETIILMIKILQLGKAAEFLKSLMDKPDEKTIELAISFLQRLDALDNNENLTPLGFHLARLPVNPQIGKMLLFGAIFSCLDPILSVAASLDFKDAFQLPLGMEREVSARKKELARGLKSDHLLLHEALVRFEQEGSNARQFCREYFLSYHTLTLLQNMKKQFMEYLYDLNFVQDKDPKSRASNRNVDNVSLIKAIVCAGLYPNVALRATKRKSFFHTIARQKVELHPKSVLFKEPCFDSPILVYYLRMKSTSDFLHDATMVHPLPVIFFGDGFSNTMEDGRNCILISDQLKFTCTESTMRLIYQLRNRLSAFLEYKISNPGFVDWTLDTPEMRILIAIMELITSEDMGDIDIDAFDDTD